MKKKLVTLALLAAFSFIALPVGGSEAAAQRRWSRDRSYSTYYGRDRDRYSNHRQYRRWRNGRKKSYWGYKNYGQYRRTQVGNRRYRYERRYYWRDGDRFSRLVRVFF